MQIDLKAGRNQIVLKIEHDNVPSSFMFRLTDESGDPFSGLKASRVQSQFDCGRGEISDGLDQHERWYRIEIHPVRASFLCLTAPLSRPLT